MWARECGPQCVCLHKCVGSVCARECGCVCVRVRVGVGLWGFVRVGVWVGGGMWVLSNQIKSNIKSNQTQNQSIKIKTSEVKVTSCSHESTPFCSHESTPALTRAPESTLIHQKDRKICEVRIPPSALMPESTTLVTLHLLPFELSVPPSRCTCVDSLLTQHIPTYIPHVCVYHTHVHTHIGGGFPGSQRKRR